MAEYRYVVKARGSKGKYGVWDSERGRWAEPGTWVKRGAFLPAQILNEEDMRARKVHWTEISRMELRHEVSRGLWDEYMAVPKQPGEIVVVVPEPVLAAV